MRMPTGRGASILAVAAALLASPAFAADVLYVKAAHVIVDPGQQAIGPGALVITDGIVTAVGANLAAPSGARQLDLGPLTVMPSFVDAHTHLAGGAPRPHAGEPTPLATPAYAALAAQRSVALALSLGVAAMRVLGTTDFLDVAIGHAIDDGLIPGPHIVPAAHPLSIIGGHDDFSPQPYHLDPRDLYTPLYGYVTSPADAEKAAQLQIKFGARVIKLMASGGVGSPLDSPADQNLTLEEMRTAVQQAHMHHMKAAAHSENLQSTMDALRAGVDSIEHGSELNQDALDYMKSHNVVLVPTVKAAAGAAVPANKPPPPPGSFGASAYSRFKSQQLAPRHLASFALALTSGVTLAAGSDDAYAPGSTGVIAELLACVEHGMAPKQAIVAATINSAALVGLAKLGRLSSGMEGDFVAMDGDPTTDIHAIERIRLVVFKGRVIVDSTKPTS